MTTATTVPRFPSLGHQEHTHPSTLDRSTGLFWVPQPIFSSMPTSTVEDLISLALSISAAPSAFPRSRLLYTVIVAIVVVVVVTAESAHGLTLPP
jgi:hypothetical protein